MRKETKEENETKFSDGDLVEFTTMGVTELLQYENGYLNTLDKNNKIDQEITPNPIYLKKKGNIYENPELLK